MGSQIQEILKLIPVEEFPNLLSRYKDFEASNPQVITLIASAINLHKREPNSSKLTFYSPNNCWKEDGTFICLMQLTDQLHIFCFTLGMTCKNLCEGLVKSNMIFAKGKGTVFYALHENFLKPIEETFVNDKEKMKKPWETECHNFGITKEQALQFTIECPPNTCIKQLNKTHAEQVNEVWPHKQPGTVHYIANLIELNTSYGVFDTNTNELMAWCLNGPLGHLSQLQTEEKHKRKGLGSLITKFLSKELAKKGLCATGTVLTSNTSSIAMFTKLGFKSLSLCYFFELIKE